MASWANQQPSGSATRRKWKLEDRASLNSLKYHIASEGCSETQYDLARQLLDDTKEQKERTSNEQAVHWLVCAAQQGHEKAAELLQQCYEENCGITAENEDSVRSCLKMTPGERAARKAARELFACLSNGNEHITPKQLERKMRKIYNLQKKRRHLGECSASSTSEDDEEDSSEDERSRLPQPPRLVNGNGTGGDFGLSHPQQEQLRSRRRRRHLARSQHFSGDLITEENLIHAAENYAAGRLPVVNDALMLSVPHPDSLDHVPCFHRLLFHPIVFFTLLYHRLINLIAAVPATVPTNLRLALLLAIYWLSSTEQLSHLLPIIFYYIFLGVMIWSTCKMLKTKQDFIDFRMWSGLFLSYGDHIEADISENRFLRNNLKPYLYFFVAFIGSLLVHPFIVAEWLPHSELTMLSGIFVFASLFVFMYASSHGLPDWTMLISFGVNVLAKYPYEMDEVVSTGWRFLDLKVPTFSSFVIGNGIEFCLNCRTALYLLIPALLVHLAKRSNWHGVYSYLIPHCVTLSWLQLCITSSQSATMFGVMRATLGLAGVLLFLPLFGIVSLMVPVFVAIDWLGFSDPNVRFGSAVVAIMLAMLTSCFLALNRTTQKYVTAMQIFICILAGSLLLFPYMTSTFKDSTSYRVSSSSSSMTAKPTADEVLSLPIDSLSWQEYQQLCGANSMHWQQQNKLKTQIRCSHLDGLTIAWQGVVTQAQIRHVTNVREDFIKKLLPNWLANIVRCLYGVPLRDKLACEPQSDLLCLAMHDLLKRSSLSSQCSLYKWNTYELELHLKLNSGLLSKGADVVLNADHIFMNFTSRLRNGDEVKFVGWLSTKDTLPNGEVTYLGGSPNTYVKLAAIDCVNCADKNIPPARDKRLIASPLDSRLRDLVRGIKYLLNVLLNPLITFK